MTSPITGPILLPTKRGVKVDAPRMLDFGGTITPPLGGATTHLQRLGTRHAIDITIPMMRSEPDGRIWAGKLRQAKLLGALARFGQDGLKIGLPGSPVVDGAGQTGSVLRMRGFTPGYAVRYSQAFNHICGGRHYLYFAGDGGVADSAGNLEIPIFPMLRKITGDGDVLNFADPMIEGSLSGNEVAWTRLTAPWCDLGRITITEDE